MTILGRIDWTAIRSMSEMDMASDLGDIAWFKESGNCGGCGKPGPECECTVDAPCGCRQLHTLHGSTPRGYTPWGVIHGA